MANEVPAQQKKPLDAAVDSATLFRSTAATNVEHSKVTNGWSDLFVEVFGEKHARSAIGVGSLPFGITVEIEAIVEVDSHRFRNRRRPEHRHRKSPDADRPTQRSRKMDLKAKIVETLSAVSTATLTTLLLKKGLRNVWMRGPRPLQPNQPRLVGRAFTMRFVPAREDLATPESWSSPRSTRAAIENMPAGCIAVVDAMGIADAGIFGDILCARMKQRGIAALVTDGAVRDAAGVRGTGLPVWCRGAAAPPSVAGLTFVGWQEPIGCGGVAVYPDDVVVVDDDGAVVVPAALLGEIVATAPEQERLEGWIMSEVEKGAALPGLYPPNAESKARYEAALRRG